MGFVRRYLLICKFISLSFQIALGFQYSSNKHLKIKYSIDFEAESSLFHVLFNVRV